MEYVFGKNGAGEFVRVCGGELIPGVHEISYEYPDMTVTDKFTSDAPIKEEGSYKWYAIHEHYKTIDKTKRIDNDIEKTNGSLSIAFVTLAENGAIDDVTAGEHAEMFSEWVSGVAYAAGNIRRYGEKLYKCLQAHTSQEGWEPDAAASLWKVIGDPTVEYPEWSQPVGAGDAYMTGDKVSHADKHWVSTVDNNVWEPGAPGTEMLWEQVVTA